MKRGAYRRVDPGTSRAAAASIDATTLESIVVDTLRRLGGATTYEIAAVTHLSLVTISPRLRPLVRKGLVRDSGLTRAGDTGRRRIVWEAA